MNYNKCYLSEIYSAIQGEGPFVGTRQLFIRFCACDLRCIWCDTPDSLIRTESCNVENASDTRIFQKIKNPIQLEVLDEIIGKFSHERKMHHSISLTGGEPLLQHKFLSLFLPTLKEKYKSPIYLESGGHRPNELKNVVNYLDYISMDFKLPSSAQAGVFWDEHKQFLEISLSVKNVKSVWVKIVLTQDTLFDELVKSIDTIKSVCKNSKKVELFLQPVSKIEGKNLNPPNEIDLLNTQSKLLELYSYVRVVPQVHRLIGQK